MPRLATRICIHLLQEPDEDEDEDAAHADADDCSRFTTTDKEELLAIDDHGAKHAGGSHSEARLSLCRTVQRLLRDDIASIREAIAQAPGDPELMSKLCRSLFSHERGKHYGKFKAAFVLNKIEL